MRGVGVLGVGVRGVNRVHGEVAASVRVEVSGGDGCDSVWSRLLAMTVSKID